VHNQNPSLLSYQSLKLQIHGEITHAALKLKIGVLGVEQKKEIGVFVKMLTLILEVSRV
jgi:hypothetical protein